MTIDNYTKVILTIIALSTSLIALRGIGIIPTASAQSDELLSVRICDPVNTSMCARVGSINADIGNEALSVFDMRK